MKASLHLKASQHLAMTPQLQQSIRLLQLSSVELQQEVAQALTENPMLEREEGDENETIEETEASPIISADFEPAAAPREELTDTADAFEQNNPIDIDEGPYDYSGQGGGSAGGDFEPELADAAMMTLREHLLTQAGLLRISWREQALVRIL
ncbi:MAG: RNA polymerase factor sigma-54, partial [Fluviibacter sp.]